MITNLNAGAWVDDVKWKRPHMHNIKNVNVPTPGTAALVRQALQSQADPADVASYVPAGANGAGGRQPQKLSVKQVHRVYRDDLTGDSFVEVLYVDEQDTAHTAYTEGPPRYAVVHVVDGW